LASAQAPSSGYRRYIITTRRITSGELLKQRNGFLMAGSYHSERDGRKIWSDIAIPFPGKIGEE